MRDIITMPGEGLRFHRYQREILSRGLCGFFLPVSFLTVDGEEGEIIKAYGVDRTGYLPLDAAESVDERIMHLLMEGILVGIREAANCYFMPADYLLTSRCLCFSEKERRVRAIFMPSGRDGCYPAADLAEGAGRALSDLKEELRGRCGTAEIRAITRVAEMLLGRKGGIDTALLSVARMKRAAEGKGTLI